MKLTAPRLHTIALLGIQDAKCGWTALGTLRQAGASRQTLNVLVRAGLVEIKDNGEDSGEYRRFSYRLSADGEVEEKRRARERA